MLGLPMVFVRLAGCSVGCPECDTDYSVAERLTAGQIVEKVASVSHPNTRWVWVTGGEPADHDLAQLFSELRRLPGCLVALATAGHRQVHAYSAPLLADWLSVSPHDPAKWVVKAGDELKLVPGLNGTRLADFEPHITADVDRLFRNRYVQPCEGKPETVAECVNWVRDHPSWRLTVQAHKMLGIA